MEENRNAFDILAGRPTGKRPLGSPSLVWKNNIRINISTGNWADSVHDNDNW